MDISDHIGAYKDALVILGTAGVVVPMVRHLGLNPVLGYLGAGVLLGPLGLGSFSVAVPVLSWFTIAEGASLAAIAELGVVFLLFLIGLELSLERLRTMRRLVFGLGSAQVVLTSLVITSIALAAGHSNEVATVIGMSLALSSTAIVIEVLAAEHRLTTSAGRATFSVLLAQDLAVIPILLFVGIAAAGTSVALSTLIAQALFNAVVAVTLIVLLGRILLRPLYRLVAATRSAELFIATTLFVIVATSVAAALAGLSMALGAFVAGLMLAETEYRKAIDTEIQPFKGLLLGIFFFTVGMKIDARELLHHPVLLLACVVGLVGIKALIMLGLARLFRLSWGSAIESGLLLGPGGEFAFVAIGSATVLGLIAADVASFTLAVTAVSMALIPLLAVLARRIRAHDRFKAAATELLARPQAIAGHTIIVGYGRVGTVVADMLQRHECSYIALEDNPATVSDHRRRGRTNVYFGNATDQALLMSSGLMEATAVIVTTHRQSEIDEIVALVRRLRPDVPIIARARDAAHARHLYAVGVTDAVPETIEASLQLSEAALVGIGLATGLVIASIHEKRDEFRRDLQQAAGDARHRTIHAVKAKSESSTTSR